LPPGSIRLFFVLFTLVLGVLGAFGLLTGRRGKSEAVPEGAIGFAYGSSLAR
jgi:hypothetical protein